MIGKIIEQNPYVTLGEFGDVAFGTVHFSNRRGTGTDAAGGRGCEAI